MSHTPQYNIFLMLKTRPAWLALSRDERNAIAGAAFRKALHNQPVRIRHFDAEAFAAECTDVAVAETNDLYAWYFVMETLRDSPLFSVPYFEVVSIIPTIEDGFRAYEEAAPRSAE